jgi:DNA modification methylase
MNFKQTGEFIMTWPDNFINRIICGDAFEIMKKIPSESIDLIITDPPYWTLDKWRNVGTTTRLGGHHDKTKQDASMWFPTIKPEDLSDLVQQCYRILKPSTHCYIFCDFETLKHLYYYAIEEGVFPMLKSGGVEMLPGKPLIIKQDYDNIIEVMAKALQKYAEDVLENKIDFTESTYYQNAEAMAELFCDELDYGKQYQLLTWDKMAQGMGYNYRARYEFVFLLSKGENRRQLNDLGIADVFEIKRIPPTKRRVPTEKPVSLYKTFVEQSSDKGDIVLDMFAGSGTVVEACSTLERKFIAIDLNSEYCEIADRRVVQEELF